MWMPIVIALYITTDTIVIKKIAIRTSGKLIDFIMIWFKLIINWLHIYYRWMIVLWLYVVEERGEGGDQDHGMGREGIGEEKDQIG